MDVLDHNTLNQITKLDEGYRIFKTIRGTPPYFEQKKRDVFAMIKQLGLPTWFISLSAAETHWTPLLKCLFKLTNDKDLTSEQIAQMDWEGKTSLVQSNPVTCVRYFDHRVQRFINNVLKSSHQPLGKINDFFYRVEFQQRGSPHIHMIIWIENAPVFDQHKDEQIAEFVDKYSSCSKSIPAEHMQYLQLQNHKHSKSCKKRGLPVCRFGFPVPPMTKTY